MEMNNELIRELPIKNVIQLHNALKPKTQWFSPGAMAFFNTKLPETSWFNGDKFYFVTKEKFMQDSKPGYTVRSMDLDGDIKSVTPFNELTRKEAYAVVKTLLTIQVD